MCLKLDQLETRKSGRVCVQSSMFLHMYPKCFACFLEIPAEIHVITTPIQCPPTLKSCRCKYVEWLFMIKAVTIFRTQTALSLTGQFLTPLLACLFFLLSSSFTYSSDVLGHFPKFLFMFVTSLLCRFYTACLR